MFSPFTHILILAFAYVNDKKLKRDDMMIATIQILLCILLILLLLLFPQTAHTGTDLGLQLFMEALFPYLLPYLILTQWLLRLTAPLRTKTKRASLYVQAYVISALGGYPTGATTIVYLKNSGQLHPKEANFLLAVCHAPSPLFVLGFVSLDLLQNNTFGWLFLCLLHSFNICCLISGYFLFRKTAPPTISVHNTPLHASPFSESIKETAPTLLLVGTTVIFFTAIQTIVQKSLVELVPGLPQSLEFLIAAVLEVTNGIKMTITTFPSHPYLPLFVVILLTMQSVSIHLQIFVIAKSAKLSVRPYIKFRLLSIIVVPTVYALFFL
ncbi:hypothetical protein AEA09_14080 [Lysinibacillus contaminans]|uniref:Sporulation integral membrane protein YlbJ n=1 Tax=Lysinibacillus contaminans TaxID=1293441 RepID=A0ABR5K416_9BACI|nr:hypothetical protein AEA09_14080 [Lysinibacillus contaminans]